jgi:hypothetical protein
MRTPTLAGRSTTPIRGGRWRVVGVGAAGLMVAVLPLSTTSSGASLPAVTTSPHDVAVAPAPQPPTGSTAEGQVPASQQISAVVALAPRDPDALSSYATAVSTPNSGMYKKFLGAGQFAAEFGPTSATVNAVTSQLKADNLTVTSVSSDNLLIGIAGSASTMGSAFDTSFENYRLASGQQGYAPTGATQVPSTIAPDVQGVVGLDTLVTPQSDALKGGPGHRPAAAPVSAPSSPNGPIACSAAVQDANGFGGLTDTQIADSYGVNSLYQADDNGAGQTIDVYELEPFSSTDLSTFDKCYFGATKAAAMASRLHIVNVDGGQQSGSGSGESILDLDDVSAVAPGATINVYEAPPTDSGYIDNFNQIVQNDDAKIVTSSWYSGCETEVAEEEPGLIQAENTIFEQAAAQGQTVLEATGDDGSDGCSIHGSSPTSPILSSSDPATQPFVTAVGGTTITDATDPPVEQVWNDGAEWGAGSGGISDLWGSPTYQADSLVPGMANPTVLASATSVNGGPFCARTVCREVPDVSAQADEFTGAVTVYLQSQGGWLTYGGTSSATPLWAAMLADISQTPSCTGSGGLGFVNPTLYAIASSPSEYAASFNDVTAGNNDIFGVSDGLFPATTGYDMGAGLGTPRVTGPGGTDGLAYYLCATPTQATATVSGLSPKDLSTNGGKLTITGTGFEQGSTPDVAGVQIGTYNLPSSDFSVTSPTTIKATVPSSGSTQLGTSGTNDDTGIFDVQVTLTDDQTSVPSANSDLIIYAQANGTKEIPAVYGVSSSGGNEAGGLTVTVYGSGFTLGTGVPQVTFGGVAGTGVDVVNDDDLTVVVPAYSSSNTTCATDLNAATDVCQVQVQVTTTIGSSKLSTILPEFSGPTADEGEPGTEFLPAPTEFDYMPTPTITAISVNPPVGLASEEGGSLATITGVGLGELGLDWVNVGPYQDASSVDYNLSYISPTVLQIALPGIAPTTTDQAVPVTVQTEGSLNNGDLLGSAPSNAVNVEYAPTPTVTSIAVTGSSYTAGPTTGGTELVIHGTGFDSAFAVLFTDVGATGAQNGFSDATSYSLTSVTNTKVTLETPGDNPGIDQVSVCNVTGCSAPAASNDIFTYYPVGNPTLTSISPKTGPKGTVVTIDGTNLGFIEAVYFGSVKATTFANEPTFTDAGSTVQITATAPAGSGKVDIQVETLESEATGYGKSPVNPAVTFTY